MILDMRRMRKRTTSKQLDGGAYLAKTIGYNAGVVAVVCHWTHILEAQQVLGVHQLRLHPTMHDCLYTT